MEKVRNKQRGKTGGRYYIQATVDNGFPEKKAWHKHEKAEIGKEPMYRTNCAGQGGQRENTAFSLLDWGEREVKETFTLEKVTQTLE